MTLTALIKAVNEESMGAHMEPRIVHGPPASPPYYSPPSVNIEYTRHEFSLATAAPAIYSVLLNNNPQLIAKKEQALQALNSQFRCSSPYR